MPRAGAPVSVRRGTATDQDATRAALTDESDDRQEQDVGRRPRRGARHREVLDDDGDGGDGQDDPRPGVPRPRLVPHDRHARRPLVGSGAPQPGVPAEAAARQRSASCWCPTAAYASAASLLNRRWPVGVALGQRDRGPRLDHGRPPGALSPVRHRALRRGQEAVGVLEVTDARARGRSGHRQHHGAEPALVRLAQGALRPVDHDPRRLRVGRRGDQRPEDALQQVHADGGPARQQQRLVEELLWPPSPRPWARRTSASRCMLCAWPPAASMSALQRDGLLELRLRAGQVAHHERRLADEGGREGHSPQGTGLAGAEPELLGLGDDLGVGLPAVEQVLRHAQVGVEEGAGQPLVSLGPPQLGAEAREPLPALVRQQAVQPDEVDQVPRVVDPPQPLAGLGSDPPGGLHVAAEVRHACPARGAGTRRPRRPPARGRPGPSVRSPGRHRPRPPAPGARGPAGGQFRS